MNQEKWKTELADTPLWLLESFAGVLLFCGLLVWLLRHTGFGRRFTQVVRPCLQTADLYKTVALLLLLLLLVEEREGDGGVVGDVCNYSRTDSFRVKLNQFISRYVSQKKPMRALFQSELAFLQ